MILVTGASGYVGGMALRRLAGDGHAVAGMARDAGKARRNLPDGITIRAGDYDDRASLERALSGVTRLLFVASDGDARDVLRQQANVIDAAGGAGIEQVVFTSIIDVDAASPFYFTPVYRDAERRLGALGTGCTILRCGLYADLVLSHWLAPALRSGRLSLPVGAARIAPISRDDVAAAAAAAVASPRHRGKLYELTGPGACSFAEIAELARTVADTPVRFEDCAASDYLERAWAEMQDPWPHAFSTLCMSIAQGRYARVSPDAETLLGRPAEGLQEFLRRALAPAAVREEWA